MKRYAVEHLTFTR